MEEMPDKEAYRESFQVERQAAKNWSNWCRSPKRTRTVKRMVVELKNSSRSPMVAITATLMIPATARSESAEWAESAALCRPRDVVYGGVACGRKDCKDLVRCARCVGPPSDFMGALASWPPLALRHQYSGPLHTHRR